MSLSRHIIEMYFLKCFLIASLVLQSAPTLLAKPAVDLSVKDVYVTVGNVKLWNKNHITWCLRNRWIKHMNVADVKHVLNEAFGIWSSESILTFNEVDCARADIHISFEKNFHACSEHFGRGNYQKSHSFPPGSRRAGTIHLLDGENWRLSNEKKYGTDLMSTALHEIGRVLGLDYSDVADSVMYIKNNKDKQTLHEDDIRQIQTLYGSANNDFSDETIYFIESLVDDTESYLLSNSKEKQ